MIRRLNQDSYPYSGPQQNENEYFQNSDQYDWFELEQEKEEQEQEWNFPTNNQNYEHKWNFKNQSNDQSSTQDQHRNQIYKPTTEDINQVKPAIINEKRHIPQINKEIKKEKKSQGLTVQGKNNAKNICRTLRDYIFTNFDVKQRQIEPLKRFLALKADCCGKQRLESFLKTEKGNLIGQGFFGNLQWARYFLEKNKIDVQTQVQYNEYWLSFMKQNQI